ncbi:hypothetical protein J437_LFUL015105 [Ladona fulva]|uniref:CRAL-TRIO domain-containing protein n=1 Tax=Ladona fulva TaxID=123851 RepID=A0A8K0K2H8_LADFU|nr:hypothetical protein J437_LFUL015105 [Ladona fulva]
MSIRPLPKDLEEVSKRELFEDPKRLGSDIQHIKEWLKKQPHIRARMDDQFIVAFLRGCKFSLERTKEKLDAYYTMKTVLKDFFGDRDPMRPEIQKVLDLGIITPLPEPDDNGRRVFLLRVGIQDPSEVKVTDVFKTNMMMMETMLMDDDRLVVCGNVSVLDLSSVTLSHAAQMTPTIVKQAMISFQEAYPVRPKGVNYVHTPPAFEAIFNLFKSFSKEKLKKRLFVHGDDMESLYKMVPQRILPREYGGEAGPLADIASTY